MNQPVDLFFWTYFIDLKVNPQIYKIGPVNVENKDKSLVIL